ncbi:MAG: nicotinate (nicotinamide) nucleotide adenylyltransferase [Acidimicrobiales bacterium]|nr:nicotinate (nicotinamide) nucleotide adenylyltransferase [Acidimicrobiales bacterium]
MAPISDPSIVQSPNGHRRVGLFGGTFDPPHVGHILTGQRVAEQLGLDEVWFVVAHDPWQKTEAQQVSPAELRRDMTAAACYVSRPGRSDGAGGVQMKVSEVELEAGGPSYSADTLRTLSARHEHYSFSLIVGSDAAALLDTWHDAQWLRDNARFIVVRRGADTSVPATGFNIETVHCPLLEISSTEIRARIRADLPVKHMVPDAVLGLIKAYALYRDADAEKPE